MPQSNTNTGKVEMQTEISNLQRENQMMKQLLSKLLQDTRPLITETSGQEKKFDELKLGEMRKIYESVVTTHNICAA